MPATHPRRVHGALALPGLALLLAACTAEPTAPAEGVSAVANGPAQFIGYDPEAGKVKVCKFGGPGDFTATANGGSVLSAFTLLGAPDDPDNECLYVWSVDGFGGTATVTITETPRPGYRLYRTVVYYSNSSTEIVNENPQSTSVTVEVSASVGATIFFKNEPTDVPPPPPPPGGQGCTPGYWKQTHHFDSWPAAYTPSTTFASVFGRTLPGSSASLTLLGALQQGGGGFKAMGRHAVAALLNSGSTGVSYAYSTAGVIAAVQNAIDTGNPNTALMNFEMENERGCPLN